MLKKISIEKFKRIEKIDIDLEKINILVGANNSGKTSILQAIQFAIGAAQTARKNGGVLKKSKVSYSGATTSFQYLPILDI